MDRALWRLLLLRQWAGLRRRLRRLRTPRGLTLTAIGIGFVVLWVAFSTGAAGTRYDLNQARQLLPVRSAMADVFPILLLASCLLTVATASGPAIYFSSAEVNFLFAGPFSRRSLLLYKFFSYTLGAMISALCITVIVPRPVVVWIAVFTGTFLTLVFMQLLSAALGLLGQVAAARFYRKLRWTFIVMCLVLVTAAWGQVPANATDGNMFSIFHQFRDSGVGRWLLAPFEVYTRALFADNLTALLLWGGIALAINVCLLGTVIWLDAEYYEAVDKASQRMRQRWQQLQRGRFTAAEPVVAARSIPQPPRCWGIGPLAWRQLTTAVRTCRRSLVLLHIIAAVFGFALPVAVQQGVSTWAIGGVVMSISVMILPRVLSFDFRGDVDYLDWLKSLPFRPVSIFIGQVAVPVLLATTVHWLVLTGVAFSTAPSHRPTLMTLAIITLPVNFLHYATENLIFLFSPSRTVPLGRVDFEFFGRMLIETMIKIFVLLLGLVGGFMLGRIVYVSCGRILPLAATVSGLFMMSLGMVITLFSAWMFRRSDITEQTPES